MIKHIVCIECPISCNLKVETEGPKVKNVSGNKCIKGEEYARSETEDPKRILTSSVLAKGLQLKMVPVRTTKPISKSKIFEAMSEIKKIVLTHPVMAGGIVSKNFLGLEIDLIATREALNKS